MKPLKALPKLKIGNLVSRLPIIQGGMGVGISMSKLAAAVANEGGIGVLSAAMPGIHESDIAKNSDAANIRVLRNEIRKAKEMTKGVLGVNVMVALTNFGQMVQTAIAENIDIVFSGAGLPLDLPSFRPPGSNTKLVPIVSSGRAAMLLCKKWQSRYQLLPDAFVVEGPKAGGHLGFKPQQIDDPAFALEKITQEVIEAVKPFENETGQRIPVIAAGGIYDGGDIDRFMKLGAAGVQMGTRFVATDECDADNGFKQAIITARKEDVVIIESPVGMPGRAVRNPFLDRVKATHVNGFKCPYHCIKSCKREKSRYCIALALGNAKKGKFNYGFAFAGSNAWRVDRITSVKTLMQSLVAEYGQAVA